MRRRVERRSNPCLRLFRPPLYHLSYQPNKKARCPLTPGRDDFTTQDRRHKRKGPPGSGRPAKALVCWLSSMSKVGKRCMSVFRDEKFNWLTDKLDPKAQMRFARSRIFSYAGRDGKIQSFCKRRRPSNRRYRESDDATSSVLYSCLRLTFPDDSRGSSLLRFLLSQTLSVRLLHALPRAVSVTPNGG